jgi:hypothetical protein
MNEAFALPFIAVFITAIGLADSDRPSTETAHVQEQGPATLRIAGDKMEDGRVEVRLSKQVHVKIAVEGPANLLVEKPASLTPSKHWQVQDVSELEIEKMPDGRTRWQLSAILRPEATDGLPLQGKPLDLPLQIAPLRYRLDAGRGDWQEAKWQQVTVRVTTTVGKADVSELRDITGPEQLPEAKSPWIPVLNWSGIALVALALLLGALELKRRLAPPKPELAPHEWAARELGRLEAMRLPEHGQAERFHTLVSDTVRRYLELRFHLRAPRQTTAEFLEAMRQSPNLNADQRILLRDFLERCDLAKFARAEYSVVECQATAAMARTFVDQTKPAPPPAAVAATNRS